jgi:hypothetical protein
MGPVDDSVTYHEYKAPKHQKNRGGSFLSASFKTHTLP